MTMSLSAVFSLWILVILRQHFSDNQASPPPSAPSSKLISSVPIQKLREEKVSTEQNSYPCHTFNVIQDCQSLRENNGFSLNMAICQYFAGNRDLGLRDYHGSSGEGKIWTFWRALGDSGAGGFSIPQPHFVIVVRNKTLAKLNFILDGQLKICWIIQYNMSLNTDFMTYVNPMQTNVVNLI